QPRRDVAVGGVPIGIDRQHFDIDSLLIHRLEASVVQNQVAGQLAADRILERRAFDHVSEVSWNSGVRVHVDGFDAPAANADLTARRCRLQSAWTGRESRREPCRCGERSCYELSTVR